MKVVLWRTYYDPQCSCEARRSRKGRIIRLVDFSKSIFQAGNFSSFCALSSQMMLKKTMEALSPSILSIRVSRTMSSLPTKTMARRRNLSRSTILAACWRVPPYANMSPYRAVLELDVCFSASMFVLLLKLTSLRGTRRNPADVVKLEECLN